MSRYVIAGVCLSVFLIHYGTSKDDVLTIWFFVLGFCFPMVVFLKPVCRVLKRFCGWLWLRVQWAKLAYESKLAEEEFEARQATQPATKSNDYHTPFWNPGNPSPTLQLSPAHIKELNKLRERLPLNVASQFTEMFVYGDEMSNIVAEAGVFTVKTAKVGHIVVVMCTVPMARRFQDVLEEHIDYTSYRFDGYLLPSKTGNFTVLYAYTGHIDGVTVR